MTPRHLSHTCIIPSPSRQGPLQLPAHPVEALSLRRRTRSSHPHPQHVYLPPCRPAPSLRNDQDLEPGAEHLDQLQPPASALPSLVGQRGGRFAAALPRRTRGPER